MEPKIVRRHNPVHIHNGILRESRNHFGQSGDHGGVERGEIAMIAPLETARIKMAIAAKPEFPVSLVERVTQPARENEAQCQR
jgi:hypothetical protein